ncbi:MAG: NUDIX hydrolase [archaeon]
MVEPQKEAPKFNVIVLGVIFNPSTRKILIGRRENDPHVPNLTWCFPGGRVEVDEDVNHTLKREIKLKTGYEVKNLGCIFSGVFQENQEFFNVYFLCEVFKGEEQAGDDIKELKWVNPGEVEKYFETKIHKRLKEYLMNIQAGSCCEFDKDLHEIGKGEDETEEDSGEDD